MERYRREHAQIRQLLRHLISSDRRDVGPDALRAMLAALEEIVAAHLADEDARLYPAFFEHDDLRARTTAMEFRSTMGGVACAFARFVATWTPDGAIERDRGAFFHDAERIVDALWARIDLEERALYPLAEGETTSAR